MFPKPIDEEYRLEALYSYAVLDTPADPAFDRITRITSALFDVPVALVTMLDSDRQWFKSCFGTDPMVLPRDVAFCSHAIMRDDVLCVPNVALDERFKNNPLVVNPPHVRFYAGAPLVTPAGFRLGTLCLIDLKPRPMLSLEQKGLLRDLAATVMELLDFRRLAAAEESADEAKWRRAATEDDGNGEAAKREFISMMSHELKTPLNAIIGFSGILSEESSDPSASPETREYARMIRESGQHLLTIVETILDFADAEKGELSLDETEVALEHVVAEAIRLLSEKAQRFNVRVRSEMHGDLPGLLADRTYLLHALLNVVGNAIKFNKSEGSVVVGGDCDAAGGVHITITDTGIGIAPEVIDRLQVPFTQIDGRLSRQYEGIGLGLAITRRLIELHGGTLSIQSHVGEGTCVTFNFPAYRTVSAAPDMLKASA
jgi:signal transduction histidine kinase